MASVHRVVHFAVAVDRVWAAVGDVGAAHEAFSGVLTDCRLEGDDRIVTFAGGMVVRERIVDVDEELRRLAYTVVDSPMDAEHHHASMQVLADGDDGSRLVWTTDVVPGALAPGIAELMDAGLASLRTTLG